CSASLRFDRDPKRLLYRDHIRRLAPHLLSVDGTGEVDGDEIHPPRRSCDSALIPYPGSWLQRDGAPARERDPRRGCPGEGGCDPLVAALDTRWSRNREVDPVTYAVRR